MRALFWLTFCGACRPANEVLKLTTPAPDGDGDHLGAVEEDGIALLHAGVAGHAVGRVVPDDRQVGVAVAQVVDRELTPAGPPPACCRWPPPRPVNSPDALRMSERWLAGMRAAGVPLGRTPGHEGTEPNLDEPPTNSTRPSSRT